MSEATLYAIITNLANAERSTDLDPCTTPTEADLDAAEATAQAIFDSECDRLALERLDRLVEVMRESRAWERAVWMDANRDNDSQPY